ncbi:MAG: family metalloprotease protein, partial [Acidimicrobiales bacterium]|nr:family metalloprotease protein [Acidimicrobiales bacterium]
MRSYRKRLLGAIGAAALVVGLAPAGVAHAAAPTPSFFPVGDNLNTTAYSLRFAGTNRFATAATTALTATQSSGTGYPFENADRTGGGSQFGSFGSPRSIFFSVGDTPADALSASDFWESGTYTLPLVGGGSGDINTSDSPMLLTESARNGATDLSSEAIAAISKIKQNCGCTPDAVVFGGSAAIPNGAVSTIDQLLGNTTVIAGVDRFDTAKRIALLNGTSSTDYYPTAASPSTCCGNITILSNSVILAEARTGADALAIGPKAAITNVPVLLTDTASLSTFTSTALAGLSPTNIVVAGGPNAISDAVVNAAKAAAGPGATAVRIFGADRYATSVEIAKQLFGYYPENVARFNGFNDLTQGLARSEGSGAQHLGWPDALTSAEFLAGIDFESSAPSRKAPAIEKNQVEGSSTTEIGGGGGDGWRTPLLLTTQGGLPSSVATYLAALYPDSTQIITATKPSGTTDGGFMFTFGGTNAVGSGAEMAAAQAVSGGTYVTANQSDLAPTMDVASTFFTKLDWSPDVSTAGGGVSDANGQAASGAVPKACSLRNALAGTEYLADYQANGNFNQSAQAWYEPTGGPYTANQSRFQCITDGNTADGMMNANGVSLSGHETAAKTFDYSAASKTLTGANNALPVATVSSHTGDPTTPVTTNGASSATTQSFSGTMNVTYKGVTTPAAPYT